MSVKLLFCSCGERVLRARYLPVFAFIVLIVAFNDPVSAERDSGSFLPTWKLLSSDEKQQFIAGYLQGWKDAAKVTDIAIGYVKTNPDRAIEGLEGIKQLYDMRGVKPVQLAQEIDAFYADPENATAGLSLAITSAKRRLQ